MKEELRQNLIEFKDYTFKMIDCIKKDDLDKLEEFLDKRQAVIDKINKIEFNPEDFESISHDLDIVFLNNELNNLTALKKEEVKEKIQELKKFNNASNAYNNNLTKNNIFSKKV